MTESYRNYRWLPESMYFLIVAHIVTIVTNAVALSFVISPNLPWRSAQWLVSQNNLRLPYR